MRITAKGQVANPVESRQRLGLVPGTEVAFEVRGDALRLWRVAEAEEGWGRRLFERMRGRATAEMTTEEILVFSQGQGS